MELLQQCREDKLTATAFYVAGRDLMKLHKMELTKSLTDLCAQHGINRTQIYERAGQIEGLLSKVELFGAGRPHQGAVGGVLEEDIAALRLANEVLQFRVANPDSITRGPLGGARYSPGFKRLILDLYDKWNEDDSDSAFCRAIGLVQQTLADWRAQDAKEPIEPSPARNEPSWPAQPNDLVGRIACDYKNWHNGVGAFMSYASKKYHVAKTAVRRVLRICGMLSLNGAPSANLRHRGDTTRLTPGALVVTDGKDVTVELATGEHVTMNWQGLVDQATACHLAVIVTKTESAAAVRQAYDAAVSFLGSPPMAFLHDNKPIYREKGLVAHIATKTTDMIAATPARPENKAVIEGEFGRWERDVGSINLDLTSKESTIASAVREVIRAYVAGVNHAACAAFGGKSRLEALRDAIPDPERDRAFIRYLKETHAGGKWPAHPLPTTPAARAIIDEAYANFGLLDLDPTGKQRAWISMTFTPEAIRQAIAIFAPLWDRKKVEKPHADRYLTGIIINMQNQLDFEIEQRYLLAYAEVEKTAWLRELRATLEDLRSEASSKEELLKQMANHALCPGIVLEQSFWEETLTQELSVHRDHLPAVLTHLRRLFEVRGDDRRRLMNRLITRSSGLDTVVRHTIARQDTVELRE